jgi:hypothetical protein
MQNPWTKLPLSAPYALASDLSILQAFNATVETKYQYDLSLLPEPYFGNPLANVVILTLNPGWSPDDAANHAQPAFLQQSRDSLNHELAPYSFLHLQPNSVTPGGVWWRRRARELIEKVGFDAVANGIACVQHTPYHSLEYSARSPRLASQMYSFNLVRSSIQRGAEVVIMRSRTLWESAVPELRSYTRLHIAKNPRSPYLSRGNLGASFAALTARLKGDTYL